MTFVVIGLGTIFNALAIRRDPARGLTPPILKAAGVSLIPPAMVVLATELPASERPPDPVADRPAWMACLGLAALLPLVIEVDKWVRRRSAPEPSLLETRRAAD